MLTTVKKPWNQKAAKKQFLSNYAIPFDMEDDAMDLRTMAENYKQSNEIIPLEDIHQGLMAILGPNYDPVLQKPYDPSNGSSMLLTQPMLVPAGGAPQFGYFDWNQLYLFSIFQRDVAANHCAKIKRVWNHSAVLIPCAIKFTLNGKVYYCIWDGHHTLQTARIMNYTKYPVWYVDIDAVPEATVLGAGFTADEAGRVKYGCWMAGQNMILINSTNKRALAHFDKFMILLNTNDYKATAMNLILQATGCVAKRNAKIPGSWTQINSGIECFDLPDGNGVPSNGRYWKRALQFHRNTWTAAPLELEVFRPLSYLYQTFDVNGIVCDAQFDTELAAILTTKYGDPESVQLGIKDSYENALLNNLGRGNLLKNHKEQVTAGLINLYNQHCGRLAVLPPAAYVWAV
jgi:hypothetical protein